MKRGGYLKRKTPLGQKPPRRKRLNPRWSREWRQTQKWIRARSNDRCEAEILEVCTRIGEHIHHIQLRSRGGSDDPANLINVCHPCHSYIHSHPEEATALGLMRHAWEES